MIVVADTAPINYLIQIGQVNLLADVYGQVPCRSRCSVSCWPTAHRTQ